MDIPGFRYRMAVRGSAVAVWRAQQRRGVPETTIVELLHPPTLLGTRDARDVVNALGAQHLGVVSVMAPLPSSTAAAMLTAGCVWEPLGPRLFVRRLAPRRLHSLPMALGDFAFGIGDLEIF
jgi:hypothetical protein